MAATYEVIDQTDRQVSLGGGQFQRQVRVTIKTVPSGIVTYVDVPYIDGWADSLPDVLGAAAAERERIQKL